MKLISESYKKNLNDYISGAIASNIETHSIIMEKNGTTIFNISLAPYTSDDKVLIYSLSKSFMSIAFGIACDEGLISPDNKTTEIFKDKTFPGMDERYYSQTFGHLLSMTSGHSGCIKDAMFVADDSVKAFFEMPLDFMPGEKFVYNTGASCMCAAAIERVTGLPLADFLDDRMFRHMGIERPRWNTTLDGTCLGGTGLYLSANDILKFGRMLLNGGIYEGRRIISSEWIKKAVSQHSFDVDNPSPDWKQGYGYQFWMNTRGGYRGDGAFGQLLVILPDENTVFVQLGEVFNMQNELSGIFNLIDSLENPSGNADLNTRVLNILPENNSIPTGMDRTYSIDENGFGFKTIELKGTETGIEIVIDKCSITCGNGRFIRNSLDFSFLNPMFIGYYPGTDPAKAEVLAAVIKADDNSLTVKIRHIETVNTEVWTFKLSDRMEWNAAVRTGADKSYSFTGVKI